MNKRGCLDLDCNLNACWHFDQWLKPEDERRFHFVLHNIYKAIWKKKQKTKQKTLESTEKTHPRVICAGKQLYGIIDFWTWQKSDEEKKGNEDQRESCFDQMSRGELNLPSPPFYVEFGHDKAPPPYVSCYVSAT